MPSSARRRATTSCDRLVAGGGGEPAVVEVEVQALVPRGAS